ncbi:MAG: holo-ACP synthase [Candidatus Zixiibacteriota bacterium]
MIIGIGIDMVDIARMRRELEQGQAGFRETIFSPDEIAYCESQRYPARHYAARFAAKEAFLKALGTGLSGGIAWRDVSVNRDRDGAPQLVLAGVAEAHAREQGVRDVRLSMTHTSDLAMAQVVLQDQTSSEAE